MLVRFQAVLFLPLLLLEAINLHVASVRALRQRRGRAAVLEAAMLGVHGVVYLGAVVGVLSPLRALVFVTVNQGLFGFYLGLTFATNHVGMPVLSQAKELSFLHRQVVTSRDVRGSSVITGFLCGGLNLQIEHHLFPTMPRVNLRRAQAIVRDFCADHAIRYHDNSVISAWAEVFRYLHQVGGVAIPAVG